MVMEKEKEKEECRLVPHFCCAETDCCGMERRRVVVGADLFVEWVYF